MVHGHISEEGLGSMLQSRVHLLHPLVLLVSIELPIRVLLRVLKMRRILLEAQGHHVTAMWMMGWGRRPHVVGGSHL